MKGRTKEEKERSGRHGEVEAFIYFTFFLFLLSNFDGNLSRKGQEHKRHSWQTICALCAGAVRL